MNLEKTNDKLKGGKGDKFSTPEQLAEFHGVPLYIIKQQLEMGFKVEMEHTSDPEIAKDITYDHLSENWKYYTELKLGVFEPAEDDIYESKKNLNEDYNSKGEHWNYKGHIIEIYNQETKNGELYYTYIDGKEIPGEFKLIDDAVKNGEKYIDNIKSESKKINKNNKFHTLYEQLIK